MVSLDKMIISASGWRGVFASGGEEGRGGELGGRQRAFAAAAAFVFCEYLKDRRAGQGGDITVLVAGDTRPTSRAIADVVIAVTLAKGCRAVYAGITAAPEIMAWARSEDGRASGFLYISASHNPVGYNGFKFGLTDGGVLAAAGAAKLAEAFRAVLGKNGLAAEMEALAARACPQKMRETYSGEAAAKEAAKKAYGEFCSSVIWGGSGALESAVKEGLKKRPLGLAVDFNGSARAASIDRDFFSSLGIQTQCVNSAPGEIAHKIVPEGDALDPCRELLEKARRGSGAFLLGYVPDCDGDRGNIVIWDRGKGAARPLFAQEVFALACVAELAHLVWTGALDPAAGAKVAVAANDATSMRVDKIASVFGASVFRAEVGEANVVTLARSLREEGYAVRVLGEGSAGGVITHPSAVRDPLNTVAALAKLLAVREGGSKPGLFKLWCDLSGQGHLYREDFCLADIAGSLPPYVTTEAYNEEAVLHVGEKDQARLKSRYCEVFLRQWEERKSHLKASFGISDWQAYSYAGSRETRLGKNLVSAGEGGLRICFTGSGGAVAAALWMRASATEPVLRIMADIEGSDTLMEREMRQWQRSMIAEADKGCAAS